MYLFHKKVETKIVRVQYEIEIKMHATGKDFKEAFVNIPDDARLIDEDVKNNNTILVFQQDTNELQPQPAQEGKED